MRVPSTVALLLHLAAATAAADPLHDLLTAARRGDVAGLRQALAAGAGVNAADPEFAQTALIRAAMFRQRRAAEVLLAAGAKATATSNLSRTALHWAAVSGAADLVPLLVKAGAMVDAPDTYGETPLGYAAEAGQRAAAEALIAAGARVDRMKKPLARHLSLVVGNGVTGPPLDTLIAIIEARQGLEVTDELDQRTPLLVAAEYAYRDGSPAAVAALVRAGANRAATDASGQTARQVVEARRAIEKDAHARANLDAALACHAAGVTAPPPSMATCTADGSPASTADTALIDRFLARGLDVRGQGAGEALVAAARLRHLAVVRRLLEAGVPPNYVASRAPRRTALAEAIQTLDTDLIAALEAKGAREWP